MSLLANGAPLLAQQNPARVVDGGYLDLSGTSMSAPVVAGVAALILQKNPALTPDEVKARIVASGVPLSGSAAPRLDAPGAVFGPPAGKSNQGIAINTLLAVAAHLVSGTNPASITWDSITWESITWDAAAKEVD